MSDWTIRPGPTMTPAEVRGWVKMAKSGRLAVFLSGNLSDNLVLYEQELKLYSQKGIEP